ncbi:signal transduction protein with cbs domains [Alcaligenes faecalis subsp. faecalis NCIB 8687]|nr:signal transduction protein with cbs domains [Alcaligenes faecalis subsp. faecalis NCIB 8687]
MLIQNFMTPDPVTVQPETPVEDIARLLLAHRINGVPVVDGAGRLIGVISRIDLLSLLKELETPLKRGN